MSSHVRFSCLLLAFILVAALLPATAILFNGCSDDEVGPPPNKAPSVALTACPPATTPHGSDCVFTWQGSDTDGEVAGYYFDLDDSSPGTWTKDATCTLQGVAVGQHTFYVQAKDDRDGRSKVVSCDFEVTAVAADCDVSPASLDFLNVNVGAASDKSFVITNNGSGALAGTVTESCDHYEFVSGGGAYSLAPLATHTVMVRFAPTTAGAHTCTIDLGAVACADVSCTGTGVDVVSCDVSPGTLDFGSVRLASTADQNITITNNGTGVLAGTVSESDPHYQITSGDGAYSIDPLGTHIVTVRFEPTMVGSHTATIDLGVGACANVPCTGIGTGDSPEIEVNEKMVIVGIQPWQFQSAVGGTYTYGLTDDCPVIEPGDILVGEDNNGYVQEVVQITSQTANELVLDTKVGVLTDAIRRCDIDETISVPLEIPYVGVPGVEVSGDSLIVEDFVLVDADFPPIIPGLDVHLYAAIDRAFVTFESPSYDFELHIADAEVTEYRTLYQSSIAYGCDISVDVTALLTYDLPPIPLYEDTKYYTTWVGPCPFCIPVVHEITTTVTFMTHFELLGQLNTDITGMTYTQDVNIGARYYNTAWEDLNDVQLTFTPPDISISAYAQATLRPYLEIKVVDKFYSLAGPSLRAEPYIEGIASTTPFVNYCLEVNAGCDVGCGLEGLGLFGLDDWASPSFNIIEGNLYPKTCWPWP